MFIERRKHFKSSIHEVEKDYIMWIASHRFNYWSAYIYKLVSASYNKVTDA